MRLTSALFSLSVSLLFFPEMMNAAEAPKIVVSDQEPELKPLGSELKHATGMLLATIDGKKEEFMTTSEKIVISEARIKAADPRAQETLRRMNGRIVETASLKAIGSTLYVTIDAYGNIQETGPNTTGDKATSVKLSFALAPDTLVPLDGQKEISYAAPGVGTGDQAVLKNPEIHVGAITKLPDGALALEGTFSATLTKTRMGADLPKPVDIKGSFKIDRIPSDETVLHLIQSKVGKK